MRLALPGDERSGKAGLTRFLFSSYLSIMGAEKLTAPQNHYTNFIRELSL
jgi:hypothetical protein